MTTKTTRLAGMDEALAAMLKTMKVDSWELRANSKGAQKLYVRCSPILKMTTISVND